MQIYLRDHYAASAGGVALADRIARAVVGESKSELVALADQISRDRAELRRVMQELAIRPNHVKSVIALVAERVARLKPNGRLFARSPLSLVIELEALGAGIHAKRDLWLTLSRIDRTAKAGTDFDGLRIDADEQLALVERLKELASNRAFRDSDSNTESMKFRTGAELDRGPR